MRTIYILSFIALNLFSFGKLSAQSGSKTEPKKAEASQKSTAQEPVKTTTESQSKTAPAAAPAPAPAKTSEKDDAAGGTQRMAITEQGVDKTKKKKSAQTTTASPAPAPKK